jgi:ankyrin repeat protein
MIRNYLFIGLISILSSPAVGGTTLEDLFTAVASGNSTEVQSLLDRGMDANSTTQEGQSLLMIAARQGDVGMVRLLLDRKANPNQRTPTNETAIMFAAFQGQGETVKLLHSRGAAVNKDGWTPLHYAAFQGHLAICRYLLENKAEINAPAPNGATALMLAARNEHPAVVKLLLQDGADPDRTTDAGATALGWAEKAGSAESVTALKGRGARR